MDFDKLIIYLLLPNKFYSYYYLSEINLLIEKVKLIILNSHFFIQNLKNIFYIFSLF